MNKTLCFVVAVTLICSIFSLPVMAQETEIEKYTATAYADIPFGDAANSHVFELHGNKIEGIDDPTSELYTSGNKDYVFDYAQNYWYDSNKTKVLGVDATDGDLYTWTHKPVYYKKTSTHASGYIPLDENNNWTLPYLEADGETVKYLTYNLKPESKVVQLSGPWFKTSYQKMSEKAVALYDERHNSMKQATVDVENGSYKNLYILASSGISGSATAPEYFTADVYYEGESIPELVKVGIKKDNVGSTDAELASITSIFNKITGNNHTKIWNYTSSMGYASAFGWYSYEIPCDINKKVDKVTFKVTASNRMITIISMLGEKPSVKDMFGLIDSTEVNVENYEAQLEAYNKIKAEIEKADLNLEVADAEAYATFTALENNIKAYEDTLVQYNENKSVFELNGNSKLFMDSTSSDFTNKLTITNYLPGLDYAGTVNNPTGDFATDKAAMKAEADTLTCLPYTINKGTTPSKSYTAIADFKSVDGKTYWTINGVDYPINPEKNIIKLVAGPVTTNLENSTTLDEATKTELVKKYSTLTDYTFDVPDGNYTSISLLAGITNTYTRSATVKFVYEDSTEETTLSVTGSTVNGKTWAEGGMFFHRMREETTSIWGPEWHSFAPYTLTPNSDKVLKEIKFTPILASGNYRYPIYIISAWGEGKEVNTLISELSAMSVTDAESAKRVKAKLNEIDSALANINQELKEKHQAIYDEKLAKVLSYEKELEAEAEKEKLGKTNFNDIPLGEGAKTTAFVTYGTTVDGIEDPFSDLFTKDGYDYVYDFRQEVWYNKVLGVDETDAEVYTWTHKPLYYKYTSSHAQGYIPLDENNNWTLPYLEKDGETVRYLTYNIKPNEKIVQLTGPVGGIYQKLSDKAKELYSAKFKEMETATIGVNDYYKNIYILAAGGENNSSISPQNFFAEVYYEGEDAPVVEELGILKRNVSSTDAELGSHTAILNKITGNSHTSIWNYTSSMGYASALAWYSYEIPCDATKKVEKITFTQKASGRTVQVISMLGEKASFADIMETFATTDVTVENYHLQKGKFTLAEEIIERENIDISVISGDIAKKYQTIKANIEYFEEIKKTFDPQATLNIVAYSGQKAQVYVDLLNPSEIKDKAYNIILAYYDKDDSLIDLEIIRGKTSDQYKESLTLTAEKIVSGASKIKGMIWKDFASLKPLADSILVDVTEEQTFMFVGDSITHSDQYQFHAETYFITRFPLQKAEFINVAKSGGTAANALSRYDMQIKGQNATTSIIMFGMNDGQRTYYKVGADINQVYKDYAIDACVENVRQLASQIKAEGSDIILMTPSVSDERDGSWATVTNTIGYNDALGKIGEGFYKVAAEEGYGIIDTYAVTREAIDRYADSGIQEFMATDRIHPIPKGYYVLGYSVIRSLFKDTGLVSQVNIDYSNKSASAENATVKSLSADNGKIVYIYNPKAIPMPTSADYLIADERYVPLTDELNREIIKVSGLEAGTYTLKMDGKVLGEYTDDELANGINIAILTENPGQIQAKSVYNLLYKKHQNTIKMRHLAFVQDQFRINKVLDDAEKRAEYVATLDSSTYVYDYHVNYDYYLAQLPVWQAENKEYLESARRLSIPTEHTVEIIKK